MTTHLRLLRADGSLLGILPDHEGLGVQEEHNGTGSYKCNYSRGGVNAHLIDRDVAYVAVVEDGVERSERYLLEEDGEDPAGDGGKARMVEVAGRGVMALLEWAIVYPEAHTPGMLAADLYNLAPRHAFVDSTPGAIILTLIDRARARSNHDTTSGEADAIRAIKTDFTSTHDSAGQPWPTTYSVTYDAGLDLLKVLLAACDNAWCDARMEGFTLRLFVPDTIYGKDRPDVIVRAGREVTSGPRKRSRRPIRSHMLGVGDEGAIVERTNTAARARYGRREGFEARGGITAVDTLTRVTDASLALVSAASEGFTLACDLSAEGPQPGVDYEVGQRIRYDQRRISETAYEPMRVRTIATAWDKAGNRVASIEVNDLFVEATVRLQRKVDGIVNGSSSNSRPPQDNTDVANDTLAPKAPGAVAVNTGTFVRDDGTIGAAATISWSAVTQNADGTVYDDAGNYYVSWTYTDAAGAGSDWTADEVARSETAYVDGLRPATYMVARVRTIDSSGNSSDYTFSPVTAVAQDTEAPPQPTAPVLSTEVGVIRATYDGLGVVPASNPPVTQAMPADLAFVEVHVSGADAFTPSEATRYDSLTGAGSSPIVGRPFDAVTYVRLVAVDRQGNRSVPSAVASATQRRVSGLDIQRDSLGRELVTFDARDLGGVKTTHSADAPPNPIDGDVWFETDAGNLMRRYNGATGTWDSLQDAAIADAKRRADEAAGAAQTAQTTANGRNKVFYQGAAPTAGAVGDLWFRTTEDNKPYKWDGAAWQPFGLGNAAIGNLDAAKITAGILDANRIGAASIRTEQLTVAARTQGENMLPNGSLTDWPGSGDARGWYRAQGTAGYYLEPSNTYWQTPGSVALVHTGGGDGHVFYEIGTDIPCAAGDTLYGEVTAGHTAGDAAIFLRAHMFRADRSYIGGFDFFGVTMSGGNVSRRYQGRITVPAGAVYMRVQVITRTGGQHIVWSGAVITKAVNAVTIANGAVTAQSMAANSITAENAAIADAAIRRAKIGDGEIDNAKIANLDVGKIIAGRINADWVVGARLKTADTGARVELNSGGIGAWNASNQQTVAIGTNGTVTITGVFRTAFSGHRIEMTTNRLRFLNNAGGMSTFANIEVRDSIFGSQYGQTTTIHGGNPSYRPSKYSYIDLSPGGSGNTLTISTGYNDGGAQDSHMYLYSRGRIEVDCQDRFLISRSSVATLGTEFVINGANDIEYLVGGFYHTFMDIGRTPANVQAGRFITISHAESKHSVRPMERGALDSLKRTERVAFRRNTEKGPGAREVLGFRAENIAEVAPLAAEYDADGKPSGVAIDALLALAFQAIDELREIVDTKAERPAPAKA